MAPLTASPLPQPHSTSASSDGVLAGHPIPPIDRIRIFSDLQWEHFVLEWADSLRSEYVRVDRCGGAGDMGRDIIAATGAEDDVPWDNYQCKHYKDPLVPGDVWLELGKVIYYTRRGEYTFPRKYFFVAPQGAGNKLSKLLRKPDQLRMELLKNWRRYCQSQITDTEEVPLTSELHEYIDSLNFGIFEAIPPLRIIDGHAKTRWYATRFGGGLRERLPAELPPTDPTPDEAVFVGELFRAYAEHLGQPVQSLADLEHQAEALREHFGDARIEFYSAESLRTFSRDTLPPGEFDRLQDEIHSGIKDEVRTAHADGYAKVLAVVKTAKLLPLDGHALQVRTGAKDKGGVCHQLANDGKVKWAK
jgi:hypothetical protein